MRVLVRVVTLLAVVCLLVPAGRADNPAPVDASKKTTHPSNAVPRASAIRPANYSLFPAAAKPATPARPPSDPMGTTAPKVDLFAGYSYLRVLPGNGLSGIDLHGGSGSLAYNVNDWFGLVADFGGYRGSEEISPGVSVDFTVFSYLFGPRFSYRKSERLTPFAQILFGGARASADAFGTSGSENAFAMTAGGGLDWILSKHIAWRVVQTEYLLTRFVDDTQNGVRVSSGIVFRLGLPAPPPPANRSPVATCSANPASVYPGDPITVTTNALDADGDSLSYDWTASGGRVDGTGGTVRWDSSGAAVGSYTVTSRVSDGKGGTTSCAVDVRVEPRPNRNPTVSCSADRSSVLTGERVNITARASDADNDNLTYFWRASGGQIVGSGSSVQLDTTGLAPGSYTVTGRVDDGRGGAADCSTSISVQAPPPPPQAAKLNECAFKAVNSARADNVCKRVLDDVALRMQSDPSATVVIVGYADPKERRPDRLAQQRADNAKKYLADKGIEGSRISTRAAGGQAGAGAENRRVDIIWVPQGATY